MSNRRDYYTIKIEGNGSANGAGESPPIASLHNVAVQISGSFVADVTLETKLLQSLDWVAVGTTSGPAILGIPYGAPVHSVRVVISNYVSGTVSAVVVGRTAQD